MIAQTAPPRNRGRLPHEPARFVVIYAGGLKRALAVANDLAHGAVPPGNTFVSNALIEIMVGKHAWPSRGRDWTDREVLYLLRTKRVQTALVLSHARARAEESWALLSLARKIDSPLILKGDD